MHACRSRRNAKDAGTRLVTKGKLYRVLQHDIIQKMKVIDRFVLYWNRSKRLREQSLVRGIQLSHHRHHLHTAIDLIIIIARDASAQKRTAPLTLRALRACWSLHDSGTLARGR